MHSKLRSILVCATLLFAALASAQTTRNVPAQYPTIQSAINASNTGDTVLVAAGTYNENINFLGKAISVTSSGGAKQTIINGSSTTATVLFNHGEYQNTILSNFTISGGSAYYYGPLGGIYISGASPIIENNIITQTQCYGIYSLDGSPLIQNNEISFVQAQEYACDAGSGSGIFLFGSIPQLLPTILGNTIEYNTQSGLVDGGGNGGAGIAVWAASPLIENNIIRYNATGLYPSGTGGGAEGGGILFTDGAGGLLINNLIYGNTSNLAGGGIAFDGINHPLAPITLLNNTIVDNAVIPEAFSGTSVIGGQQIYFAEPFDFTIGAYDDPTPLTLLNNIVSGSTTGASVVCLNQADSLASFSNNDFFNSVGPVTMDTSTAYSCTYPAGTAGNLSVDPGFALQSSQNYHLLQTSPTVDTGNNAAIQLAAAQFVSLTTDLDGNPRILDATGKGYAVIDMGAYEYPGASDGYPVTEALTSSLNPSLYGNSVTFSAQLTSANGTPTGSVEFSDGSTVLATQTVSNSGLATFSTSQLTIGTHTITAAYQPTDLFASTAMSLAQVVTSYATNATLTCTPTTVPINSTALLTATVTSPTGTPTGSIAFADNGATLAQPNLTNGIATDTYTATAAGTHTLTATYVPTGSFAGSSASCTEVVTGLPTTSTLTVTPTTAPYTTPITLTATVAPTTPPPGTPTGTVTFVVDGVASTPQTLTANIATLTLPNLAGGNHTFSCTYSGDATYTPSTCNTASTSITPAATNFGGYVAPSPAYALQPITIQAILNQTSVAGGNGHPIPGPNNITITYNPTGTAPIVIPLVTDANGQATTIITAGLPPGTYPITYTFAGTANYAPCTATITLVVNPVTTYLDLTTAPNPAGVGQSVTFTATISGTVVPTGNITFLDSGTPIGTAPLNNGIATFITSTLAIGTHPITATFAATTNYGGSTSPTVQQVILPSSFAIALSPTTLTLPPGQQGTDTIQLTSIGAFAGPLTLTYGSLPQYASATIAPSTVTLTLGSTATATLTLKTTEIIGATHSPTTPRNLVVLATLLVLLPFTLRARRTLPRLLALLLAAIALQSLTGCTEAYELVPHVLAGTYQIPITATDSNANTQTAILTLTVTP